MHFAKLDTSNRLKRVLTVLCDGPKTTRDIIEQANVVAVSAAISELRRNGFGIECRTKKVGETTIAIYHLKEEAA